MIKLQRILKLRTALTQAMGSSSAQEQENKRVVRQFFEAFDLHDTERMDQLVSSTNYSFHFSGMPPMDWNGHKQFIVAVTTAFPDVHHDIVDMVAEGEGKVAIRVINTGTHKEEFHGIPPTGKKVSFDGMQFLTIINGKITEIWGSEDVMGLMQQIGAIPAETHAGSGSTARS